jgi:hypothetical protein
MTDCLFLLGVSKGMVSMIFEALGASLYGRQTYEVQTQAWLGNVLRPKREERRQIQACTAQTPALPVLALFSLWRAAPSRQVR